MFPIGDQNEPGHGLPYVTLAIIGLNVAVFLLLQQAGADNTFTYGWSAIPYEITHGVDLLQSAPVVIDGQQYLVPEAPGPSPIQLTLLSSMFMHAGWLHLGGNMLFLWVFGDNVEHRAGPILYLLIYLALGVVASLAQILSNADSFIPTLGASGAISGILGAYIVLFPTNRVTVFAVPLPDPGPGPRGDRHLDRLPADQRFRRDGGPDESGGGVAYLAHIGGFAAGAAGRPPAARRERSAAAGRAARMVTLPRPRRAGDAGLFGPGSMAWRIDGEALILAGGTAALLMQLAHPAVAAGVAQHSDFRADPFARLRRTLPPATRSCSAPRRAPSGRFGA